MFIIATFYRFANMKTENPRIICIQSAQTSAYYAVAPFIAAILSLIVFREFPDITYFTALGLMIVGAWLSSQDKPLHEPDPSGQTGGIRFWGNSFVAGPQGELLTVFPNDEEEVRVIEIDKTRGENVRRWWPFFRDRRIDAFGGLTERFLV